MTYKSLDAGDGCARHARPARLAILVVALGLMACGGGSTDTDIDAGVDAGLGGDRPMFTPEQSITFDGPRTVGEPDDEANYVFDDGELRTYELELSDADLASIDADPTAERYVVGTLRFEDQELSPVGIRYKGSVGAFTGCVSGMDGFAPSGRKTCTKLSMKVKVNWESDDQLFYGLKKLQFHAVNGDSSMMRDRLMYKFFRQMGVPAARAVHARLVINGQYSGVYVLVEQMDGRFTRSRFADGDGNLYKEVWPTNMGGSVASVQAMREGLKTNENDGPDGASVEKIRRFATEVTGASPGERSDVLERWMDLEQTMRQVVVDRIALNDDGAYHWYCDETGCAPHNFFWYEEVHSDRVYLLPWDMDHAMRIGHPVVEIADDWDETRFSCAPFTHGVYGLQQVSAACDPILGAFATQQASYDEFAAEFLDGLFSADSVNADMARWTDQIRDALEEARAA